MQDLKSPTQTQSKCELDFKPLTIKELSSLTEQLRECKAMLCDYTPGGLLFGIKELYSPMICKTPKAVFISVRSDSEASREYMLPIGAGTEAVDILFEYAKDFGFFLIKYWNICGFCRFFALCEVFYSSNSSVWRRHRLVSWQYLQASL